MPIHLDLTVADLVDRYPWAEDVLQWHGVSLESPDLDAPLRALCWLQDIDTEELLEDLCAVRDVGPHPWREELSIHDALTDGLVLRYGDVPEDDMDPTAAWRGDQPRHPRSQPSARPTRFAPRTPCLVGSGPSRAGLADTGSPERIW